MNYELKLISWTCGGFSSVMMLSVSQHCTDQWTNQMARCICSVEPEHEPVVCVFPHVCSRVPVLYKCVHLDYIILYLHMLVCVCVNVLKVCRLQCVCYVCVSSYICRRLVLDRLLDVRLLTRVFGWGMIGWGRRAGISTTWAGIIGGKAGLCWMRGEIWWDWAGLGGLAERELNFFFPPSPESEVSSSAGWFDTR